MKKKEKIEEIAKIFSPIKWGLRLTQSYWYLAIGAFICVVIAQSLESLSPLLFKKLIDAAQMHQSGAITKEELFFYLRLFPLFVLVMPVFWRLSGFFGMHWFTSMRKDSLSLLFKYVTLHDKDYFSNRFAGAIANKISNASGGVRTIFETLLWELTPVIVSLGISLYLCFSVNHWFGISLLLWIVLFIPVNYYFSKKKFNAAYDRADASSKLKGQVVDGMSNMSLIQQYASRIFEIKRIGRFIEDFRALDLKSWKITESMLVANSFLQFLLFGILMEVSIYLLKFNLVTLGEIVLLITLVFGVNRSLLWLGQNINSFMEFYGETQEGLEEILIPHNVVDSKNAKEFRPNGGDIDFQAVSFSYGKTQVFEELNLTIPSGQKVGIVGESGAGKTTLVDLFLRQYDISGGEILVDNQNISNVTKASWRKAVSCVGQDSLMFHRTIRENILYGKQNASEEELTQAAKHAQAHDFIMSLEEGYDTLVGERGVKLSGGQRQRISVARALLKESSILVLDEATSALDSKSEVNIQKALKYLMQGKTVLAVAHRLSTLRDMNRILVFDKGKIAEDGTHEELIKLGGIYADLWNHQAGGFLTE